MKLKRRIGTGLRLLRSQLTSGSAALLYHRIAESAFDPWDLCVAPDHFEAQLSALRDLGQPLDVETFVRRQQRGSLAPGSLCLTFDDGTRDFLDAALPLLERYEAPAVVFCVSGNLGRSFWWDRLSSWIASAPADAPALRLWEGQPALDPGKDGATETLNRLYEQLLPLPAETREERMQELQSHWPITAAAQLPGAMSDGELRELADHPLVTIGAHTVSHPRLATLAPAGQAEEIAGSVAALGDVIGRPVRGFSYPFGMRGRDYDHHTLQAARDAGLQYAMAVNGDVVTARSGALELPRLWVHDGDDRAFTRRIGRWL